MKLILLSKHFIEPAQASLRETTNKQNTELIVAFCDNASAVYEPANREYIEISRNELIDSSYSLVNLDLNSPVDEIVRILKSVDAVYFTGGSVYKLMSLFISSGIAEKYKEILNSGLVHIGFSAGSMVCSNDFRAYDIFGEPDYRISEIKEGLRLFPYYIVPHYFDKPKYTTAYQNVVKAGFTNVIPLTNSQAIIVEDSDWRIIQ